MKTILDMKTMNEFEFIDKIKIGCIHRPQGLIKGIGDDAAVIQANPPYQTIVTTDMLIETIHFLRDSISGFELGYKSLSVNLSDIAAMGGIPTDAFINIAIPKNCRIEFVEAIYDGLKHLAQQFQMNISGGDTTRSPNLIVISITVMGYISANNIMFRHTAKPGDVIFATGFIGDSRAGLHLITNHIPIDSASNKYLYQAHIKPFPQVKEGQFLAQQHGTHAAIDISDGLSSDIGHILKQSQVGACIYADRLPLSDQFLTFCKTYHVNPIEYALSGGEDYILVCTIDNKHATSIQNVFQSTFGRPLYHIGVITESLDYMLQFSDNTSQTIHLSGWDHFKE